MAATESLRWSHVGLNCVDQKLTEEFYTRWFGFRRARMIEAGDVRVIFLRRGEAYLELFTAGPGTGPAASTQDGPAEPGTVRHLAFQVDDVEAFIAEAGEAITVTLGPLGFDEVIPGWKTVWLRDPDGVIIEVSQGYTDQSPADLGS